MKHYRLPRNVEFPELDAATKAELDAMFAESDRLYAGRPEAKPEVTSLRPAFLRTLPPRNRAMYKYVWLRHVRKYEDYMRRHPEQGND